MSEDGNYTIVDNENIYDSMAIGEWSSQTTVNFIETSNEQQQNLNLI